MTITPEQLERRRKYLGSSDVAAVCGLDRFKSAFDVWLSKVYRIDKPETEGQRRGRRLEPTVLSMLAEDLKLDIDTTSVSYVLDHRIAHPDGVVIDEPVLVEAKTWAGAARDWDTVPDEYLLQVQHALDVTGKEVATVGVLLPRFDLRVFHVEPDAGIQADLREILSEFWHKHVLEKREPDGWPSLEVARWIRKDPEAPPVQLDEETDELLDSLEAASALASATKKRAESLRALAFARLGESNLGRSEDHEVSVSEYETTRYSTKYTDTACPQCGVGHRRSTSRRLNSKSVRDGG